MDVVSLFLIATAGVLLLGVLGEVVFQRTGIPRPLWLAFSGLLLGPVIGLAPRDDLAQLAPYVALPALVTVVAEMGSRLDLDSVRRGANRAGPLAALSFLASLIVVTFVSFLASLAGVLPEDWGLSQSLLLGAILGASSTLIIAPSMVRSRVTPSTTQYLELAAAMAGAGSIFVVSILVAALAPEADGFLESVGHVLVTASVALGLGLIWAALWFGFLYALQAPSYAYTATLASLLVLHVVTEQLGGSGPIAVLTCSALVANAPVIAGKLALRRPVELSKDTRGYRRLIMFLVRSTFFLFVGLLLGPPWSLVGLGVMLALMLFLARLPAVFVSTKWGGWSKDVGPLAAVSMPRGMLVGVLALLPLQAEIEGAAAIPLTVFATIVVTITIFALGFPFARRKLPTADVVALDVDGEIGASPVAIVTPDETSRRALMPPTSDELVGAKPETVSQGLFGPLPPPAPPPRPSHDGKG